jgi:signal transduction histidine kinase
VSNDLTAIVLVGADERLEIARCRVGFGYPKPTDGADGSPSVESLTVIRELHDEQGSVIIDEPAVALGPAGSVLGAALRVGDRRIGFVVLESVTKGFFTTAHAERLRAIADQAASAISNARLVGQASELAAAEERQRLSRELHDAVNQTLWTASLTADSLLRDVEVGSELHRRLQRLRTLTSGAQAEMRTLLLELRPQELVEVDLHELLGHLVAAMECRKKLEVTVELEPVDLEPAARVALYRIAQEALTNITRHSAATVVSLTLRKRAEATSSGFVELRIVDNGRGFDVDNVSPGHLGLSIMGERAEAIGAELVLRAAPGHGTDLTVCLRG